MEIGNFKSRIYDITTKINGEKVQQNGKVLVGIPIPEGFNPERIVVVFISNDGSGVIELESFVENGMIWFETDHFSLYAIVDESEEIPTTQCNHLCHKTGFMGFIWKIVRLFWKMFKINSTCECGAMHY